MNKWMIDVPVLLIFFVRQNELRKVFDSIKKAKPSTLLLWQDGPRTGREDDMVNIKACREIVENIDWDCTVYRQYHDKNMGCDPSTFLAQKWAFTMVDKCIILEDDRVPDPSFYLYCKELLDKYENDERISHICGTNLLGNESGVNSCDADYFFASRGSTTWASWRRVAEQWDEGYSYLTNQYVQQCLKSTLDKRTYKQLHNIAVRHKKSGKQYWETILGMSCILNHQVAIIPRGNLVCDIGLTENSTHALADRSILSNKEKSIFDMETYPMPFPMRHPKYIIIDGVYEERVKKIFGESKMLVRTYRMLMRVVQYIRYGRYDRIRTGLNSRLKR